MRRTTAARAWADPTRHSLKSAGFFEHGPDEDMRLGAAGMPAVLPPYGTADNSLHLLQPPLGNPPITCRWLMQHQAWAPEGVRPGHRLAFSAAYLGSHGWSYSGPSEAPSEGLVLLDEAVGTGTAADHPIVPLPRRRRVAQAESNKSPPAPEPASAE